MKIAFLDIDTKSTYLLGYELKLSKTEQRLLYKIAMADGLSSNSLLPLLGEGVGQGNVAVHINSINKKAERISGRRLVIFENSGYKLNPFM